jgi:hypothetical protein
MSYRPATKVLPAPRPAAPLAKPASRQPLVADAGTNPLHPFAAGPQAVGPGRPRSGRVAPAVRSVAAGPGPEQVGAATAAIVLAN